MSQSCHNPDNLYVLEHDHNGLLQPGSQGSLWRIAPEGVYADGFEKSGLTND